MLNKGACNNRVIVLHLQGAKTAVFNNNNNIIINIF